MRRTLKGRVKWFNAVTGYGFITPEAKHQDIFVHFSNILAVGDYKSLDKNERVEYEEAQSDRAGGKLQAVNVRSLDK